MTFLYTVRFPSTRAYYNGNTCFSEKNNCQICKNIFIEKSYSTELAQLLAQIYDFVQIASTRAYYNGNTRIVTKKSYQI